MGKIAKYTRRGFLGLGIAAAGGLAVGYYYYKKPYPNPLEDMTSDSESTFNPYVIIGSDNSITIFTPRAEMGQGIHTTLAALVAEELDVTMEQISVQQSPTAPAYYNETMLREGVPFAPYDEGFLAETARSAFGALGKMLALQTTGGSSATIDGFVKMREAGCATRLVLVKAAANRWGVDETSLETGGGLVRNPANGEVLTYGALAADAALLEPPSKPDLKPRSYWRLLGKSQKRVEIADKVTGGRIFGIDMELPDMLHGTVVMSPRFGAGAVSADRTAALAVAGVQDVVEINTSTGKGFGIIASNTWAAFQGAEALAPVWEVAGYPADTDGIAALYDAALDGDASFTLGGNGDAVKALDNAPDSEILSANYSVPYLAHTTMEPMNATAQFTDGHLTIWVGTQAPGVAQMRCADLLGIDGDAVTIHTLRMGGGFGRRGEVDVPLYAAAMAAKTNGRPIKVTWTREEDTRHDMYRPMVKARMRAHLGGSEYNNVPKSIEAKVAAPSISKSLLGRTFPGIPAAGQDRPILDGMFDQPVSWENSRFAAHQIDTDIPVGFWRSVGHSANGFFHETFMDEIGHAMGRSTLPMRIRMLNDPRFSPAREAMMRVAKMSGWQEPLPEGKGQGFAFSFSFGTWVAEVVQVDMREGDVVIEKVWAVADPGVVLDPQNFKTQIVSGIIYGLSAAMMQKITFADGMVEQGNFYDYDAIHMAQCPDIEVELLLNSEHMGGAGEPSTPPAAAALGNAIFAASGQRIRSLPFGDVVDFRA